MERKYVDYFDEIKHKSKREQLDILSRARYEAFVVQPLGVKAAAYLFLVVLVSVAITSAVQAYFSLSSIFAGLIQALVIIGCVVAYKHLCGKLLYRGLICVLAQSDSTK